MLFLIKRFARILGIISFFAIFVAALDHSDPLNVAIMGAAALKGLCGAGLFWFAGFVIGDIVFKGVIEDMADGEVDRLEGGLVQRVIDVREESALSSNNDPQPE